MNVLKKIIVLIALFLLVGQSTINSFAAMNSTLERKQSAIKNVEENLKIKIKGSEEIISKITVIVSKINDIQANKLGEKLNKIRDSLIYRDDIISDKEEQTLLLINYIILKLEEKELINNSKIENSLLEEYGKKLSNSENKKLENEIVKMQKQLLKNSTGYLETLMGEFEKYTSYEEKGDFSMNLNIEHELVGEIEAQLELNDYTVKNSGFDSQITTKVKAIIDAAPRGEEAVKLEFSAFMDFILKDQNYYVLLNKLNIIDEQGVDDIEEFIEKAKEIATHNKYIHFMEIVKGFTPQNILSQGNTIMAKPLFRGYKKQGYRYYVIPTKYACDTMKELTNKFDPFNGSTCTQSQYEDLLADIAESKAEVYIEFGVNTTIGFEANGVDEMEELHGKIAFSNKYIKEVELTAKPNQEKYPNEGAKLIYKRASHLNANIYAKSGEVDINFTSTLDRNNRFTEIDSTIVADDFNGDYSLNNNKIVGKYNIDTYSGKILGTISGRTSQSNTLSKLDITNQVVSTGYSNYNNISDFSYNKGAFSFSNNYNSDGTISEFEVGGNWDSRNNILTAGDIKLLVKQKDSSYDYSTYKRIYSGDFKEIVSSNIKLKSKIISGNTHIYTNGVELVNINHSGKYEKDYFEMNNAFDGLISTFFLGTEGKDSGNINVKIDTKGNNNNGNIYVDIKVDTKKVFEFELDNASKKTYKKVQITAPKKNNTIELDEIIDSPEYLY